MSSDTFKVIEHKVPCGHIRGYPQSVLESQETVLHLAVKQYIPLNNPSPQPGDLTIIAAHANGFPKELYEPLWDELLQRSSTAGYRIRGIWIADLAWQGQSYVLNEDKVGIHANWNDHSRDLLYLINQFRADMPRPLVGIGHSIGGFHLAQLSLLHPRLFETLVLVDPIIAMSMGDRRYSPAPLSARRRDVWPSREAAAASFRKSPFYQPWDPRVLDRWIKYGLRDLPTRTHPLSSSSSGSSSETAKQSQQVTLTTPKMQEVLSFAKEVLSDTPKDGYTPEEWELLRDQLDPDQDPDLPRYPGPVARPEVSLLYKHIPFLRPSVLYLLGAQSPMPINQPGMADERAAVTGNEVGGSGGAARGRVKTVYIPETGHLVPMEKVGETADAVTGWLAPEMARYRKREEVFTRYWRSIPDKDKHTLSEGFMQVVKDVSKL